MLPLSPPRPQAHPMPLNKAYTPPCCPRPSLLKDTVVCARLKVVIIQSPTTQLHHLVSPLTTVTVDCGSTSYPTNSLERQKVPHCGAYALYISSESESARRWHQCGTLFWGKGTANSRSIVLSHKVVKAKAAPCPTKFLFRCLNARFSSAVVGSLSCCILPQLQW